MRLTPRGERLTLTLLIIATLAGLILAGWIGQQWKRDRLDRENQTQTCVEDMSCWSCTTMGNGECGR